MDERPDLSFEREVREPRYRELVESLPQLVWTCSPDGAAEYANRQLLAYHGVSEEQFLRKGWCSWVHPDEVDASRHAFRTGLAVGYEYRTEHRLRRHDGQYRWFDVRTVPLCREDGTLVRWLSSSTDIDDARQVREALRATQERLETMAAATPEMLHSFRIYPDGRCSYPYASPAFVRLYGCSAEELARDAHHLFDMNHPDDIPGLQKAVEASVRTMSPWRAEWRANVPGRGLVWLEGHSMPVKEADGSITWHGSLSDVTERKEREARLRESELELSKSNERFHDIADSLNHVFWVFETEPVAHVAYVSPAFTRLWGHTAEELYRSPRLWHERIHPEDRARVVDAFDHWHAEPALHPTIAIEYRILRPEGTVSWIRDVGRAQVDADGRLLRASGIAEDITAQKLAEQALRREREVLEDRVAQRTAELEAANRELEAFSYSVSHDLRAPLRIVNGFADALLEDFGHGLQPEALRYIGNLREGGRRMSELIGNLLSFSQLGRRSIERAPVDVHAMVEECLAELGLATRGGAFVTVGELASCSGDGALLKQVFLNLLSNAFKYSRNRTPARVEVGCHENQAGEIVYFVRDNGTGFDMSYAHRLFHVFQRLHREQEFEGTGVGLAIVKRIVSSHGGRVWAEAEPESGATFSFTLGPAAS
jgi:PAS domain S-box-containing protein